MIGDRFPLCQPCGECSQLKSLRVGTRSRNEERSPVLTNNRNDYMDDTEAGMLHGERRWIQTDEVTDRVVVVPLGSLEQHGHHLPLLTDTLIITEIARRAETELGDEALFLPTSCVGAPG